MTDASVMPLKSPDVLGAQYAPDLSSFLDWLVLRLYYCRDGRMYGE